MAVSTNSVHAHSVHEHGKAQIKLVIEGNKMLLVFETPQDSLVGIERAPQSRLEIDKANAALAILRNGSQLFSINPEAVCAFKSTNIDAASLVVPMVAGAKPSEHADVVASYSVECAHTGKLNSISVGVFDAFKSIKVIQVQFVGPKKQKTVRLTSSARTIKF
jgi:hypothetical protein